MSEGNRDREALMEELTEARRRIVELEALEAEHKRAEAALEAAEWEKEMILDSQLEIVVYQDLDHKILWVNRAGYESVNATREDLIGSYCYAVWAQRSERCEDCPVAMALQAGEPREVEKTTPDGRSWFIRGYPVRDEAGQVIGAIEITQDISERKRFEQEVEDQKSFLRNVIDGIPSFIFVKNRKGEFVLANEALAEAYGTTVDELIGKTDADFNPNTEEVEQFLRADLEVMNALQEKLIPDEVITDAAGNKRWLQTVKRPLVDQDGMARRILGVSIDITAQKETEAARVRLQHEVIEAQQQALQELSTPIIPVMEVPGTGSIIVMPLIGGIDSMRAKDLMRALLAGIRDHRAKVVILDITGVPIVDSGVANHLNKTIQAARLKGARTIVTGISDAVAETVVDLGIDWSGIETLPNLQTGLLVALNGMGVKLTRS